MNKKLEKELRIYHVLQLWFLQLIH